MFSDSKTGQLSENLLQRDALFETSIKGRDTLYEEISGPSNPLVNERPGIMRNYRRHPPIVLSEDQK
jgi:hypothetical protein